MMRSYNAREGLGREDDTLPAKLFRQALSGGRSDGIKLEEAELETAKAQYYELAGWDENGTPTRETLSTLGLDWVADELGR